MAFAASFTASQSIDGKTLTFTDTSNYGDGGTNHKTDFSARRLKVIRGDDISKTTTYDFPFTGTPDGTHDTFSLAITQDYAYSVTMELVHTGGDIVSVNNPVLTTQFIELNKLTMLNQVQPCDCNKFSLLDGIDKIQIALLSAVQRASTGDISGSNQLVQYAFEYSENYKTFS